MLSLRSLAVLGLVLAALPALAQESASPAAPASPASAEAPVAEASPAFDPAAAASAAANVQPPEVKDGKLHSPSGDFTITLPAGWKLSDEPKEGAQCDVESETDADVFVETDERDEDLGTYMTKMIEGMKASPNLKKVEETTRKDVTVAGLKGIQARVSARGEKDIELEYFVWLFNSEKLMYHIVGISAKADLEKNEKDILAIADSFKLGK